ncbi:MAG: hypothetical protein F4W90_03025 [Gammaproteobacteria bacterium]|nr:hypothetical protein [Gammaproteobacteria bacterium]
MKRDQRAARRLFVCCLVFATFALAQDEEVIDEEAIDEDTRTVSWLPAQCVPVETIGFHDGAEAEGEPVESFIPVNFKSVAFTLRENPTLEDLLDEDEQASLYMTMQNEDSGELFEFTCQDVLGANREQGYSCVNTPPSDILMLNPRSMRFSRAAIGSWTFQSTTALRTGSSLFVEMGQCYSLDDEAFESLDEASDSN